MDILAILRKQIPWALYGAGLLVFAILAFGALFAPLTTFQLALTLGAAVTALAGLCGLGYVVDMALVLEGHLRERQQVSPSIPSVPSASE